MLIDDNSELIYVRNWISRKIKLDDEFPYLFDDAAIGDGDWYSKVSEARSTWEVIESSNRFAVEKWCNTHLDEAQLVQMGSAVRNAKWRERNKSRDGVKKINLDYQAWVILSELAKHDGVTLSEAIISRLEAEYFRLC